MDRDEQKRLAAARVRDLRLELGLEQDEFARHIGLQNGQSQVSRWERGASLPSAENAALLAAKGNGDPLFYRGIDIVRDPSALPTRTIRVVGELQAGAWKESIEWHEEDQYDFPLAEMMGVPRYDMQAYIVRGTSMNRIYPEQSVVLVANLFTNPIQVESGDIVLVQRRNRDGMYEASLKEYVVERDGSKWLWPRSHDPEFQSPLNVAAGNDGDSEVTVQGVVVFDFVPRRKFKTTTRPATGDPRIDQIIERHNAGESHPKIAADFGLTRERVRQIVEESGAKPRRAQRQARKAQLRLK